MQRKIIFRSKCPFCDNNDGIIEWKHSGCQGIGYLDTNGDITCENCNTKINLLNTRFDCGMHEYRFGDCGRFGRMETIRIFVLEKMNYDECFKYELLYNVSNRWIERNGRFY